MNIEKISCHFKNQLDFEKIKLKPDASKIQDGQAREICRRNTQYFKEYIDFSNEKPGY
ncbi:MAG: hypothetical protein QM426_07440 [Euryarchaeota archaeon]|nr:hypothetical protein [Euryarchaeota archaeon]